MNFQAITLRKDDQGFRAALEQLNEGDLPEGQVTVDIEYSTINYKDALAIAGKAPVVRSFPMVAGIDFAGRVRESRAPGFRPGDAVVLNGWGVGEGHWGGLAQCARVQADWLIALPDGLSTRQAMAIGTAGYTAMLCVQSLEEHGLTAGDEVLVTGASGGVGSIAIRLLAKRGLHVTASTGKSAERDYLKSLGATEVIDRSALSAPGKPLAKERWAGIVDTVGGTTLANACAATRYGGIVTACGMAQSLDLPASVAPFILRSITLRGIDSVYCPLGRRLKAWAQLAKDCAALHLDQITQVIGLEDVVAAAGALIAGSNRGRLLVEIRR